MNRNPTLKLPHPNARCTGSEATFELHPATIERPGFVRASFAPQISMVTHYAYAFATEEAVSFDLGFSDIGSVLEVLHGCQETINNGKGICLESANAVSRLKMSHVLEPVQCYEFVAEKSEKCECKTVRFLMTTPEAFSFSESLKSCLSLVSFGVPAVCAEAKESGVGDAD